MKWRQEQLNAINARKGNYLVSASAGSGKTAVLTERAFQLIHEGVKVSELLVLTFAKDAASEMKDRIRKKLLEHHMYKEAAEIDLSSIQTFDAFALSVVKTHYYRLGVSKDVSIFDKEFFQIEKNIILKRIFDKLYQENSQVFSSLLFDFCTRDDYPIFTSVLNVSRSLENVIDRDEYYSNFDSEYLSKEYILKLYHEIFHLAHEKISECITKIKTLDSDMKFVDKALEYLNYFYSACDYDEFYSKLYAENVVKYPSKRRSVEYTQEDLILMDHVKSELNEAISLIKTLGSKEDFFSHFEEIKKRAMFIMNVSRELDDELDNFKRKNNAYDFFDIARLALKALQKPDILQEYRNKFRYIMVDEYQDTNDIQDKVVSMLAQNNLFVVGDIKQSIYRFRNANPAIFIKRFDEYGKNKDGHRIDMNANFRSCQEVINDNNTLFIDLMNAGETGFDYKKDHTMEFANSSYQANPNAHHEIYFYESTSAYENRLTEIEIIANDIIEKINAGYLVNDSGKYRKCRFSDFAILIDRKKSFDSFYQKFKEKNIPLIVNADRKIYDHDVLKIILNIIKMLLMITDGDVDDNFAHPFASILRSYLFMTSDETIYNIISKKDYASTQLYAQLVSLAKQVETLPLCKILDAIYSEFQIIELLPRIGNIETAYSVIEYLNNIAKTMERLCSSLKDYYEYFESIEKYEINLSNQILEQVEDAVTITTIHKSKGLQYKIVYLPLLGSRPNDDSKSPIFFHSKYGIDIPFFDGNKQIRSPIYYLAKIKEGNEDILERLRTFYVALTRAEEKVIFIDYYSEKQPIGSEVVQSLFAATSFRKMLTYGIYHKKFKYTIFNKNLPHDVSLLKQDMSQLPSAHVFLFPSFKMKKDLLLAERASKKASNITDLEALEVGNKFHAYLEKVDFHIKDTQFINDSNDRRIIDDLLKNQIFDDVMDAEIRQEFPFYDEESDVYGYIDLLMIFDDKIVIIDYKTSSIDDDEYNRQIKVYASYLRKIDKRPIKGYLLSILYNELKEVGLD